MLISVGLRVDRNVEQLGALIDDPGDEPDPERHRRARLTIASSAAMPSSVSISSIPSMPKAPASLTARASRPPAWGVIGALISGTSTPSSSVSGVAITRGPRRYDAHLPARHR